MNKSKWKGGQTTFPVALLVGSLSFNTFTAVKSIAVILLVILIAQRRILSFFDKEIVVLSLLLISYCGGFVATNYSSDYAILSFTFPVSMYLLGKWAGMVCENESNFFNVVFATALALSISSAIPILTDIVINGFAGGVGRNIAFAGASNLEISATVLGGNLALAVSIAGVLFCPEPMDKTRRALVVALLLAAIVCVIRLGSRTHLLLFSVSLLIGCALNWRNFSLVQKISVVTLLIFVLIVLASIGRESVLLTFYLDRIGDDASSAITAGGRVDRWMTALSLLMNSPGGWDFNIGGYAHNFWLDAARVGGWIPFILSISFSIVASLYTISSIFKHKTKKVFVTITICITGCYNMLFFVEPILDGFLYPFSAYCAFLGIIVGCGVPRSSRVETTKKNIASS